MTRSNRNLIASLKQVMREPEPVYEVVPLVGIGPVGLGMSRKDSRFAMEIEPETFRKSLDDKTLTDTYNESTFQVFFDVNDTVEYIELLADGFL